MEPVNMPDHNGSDRLDRIERVIELLVEDHIQFRDEHKSLLKAQVLLTDTVGNLTKCVETIAGHLGTLTVKVEVLADKLNGLIGYMEGQHKPPQ
jgi:hypothetical protein